MAASDRVNVTVSVDDAHLSQIDQVVERLRSAGMHVDSSLASIGTILGHVAGDQVHALSRLPGVAAVEPERSYQLPPPESPIQ